MSFHGNSMEIKEDVPVGPKTTMRIGGNARYFAELKSEDDCVEAIAFAKEKNIPFIVLGSGSNTIFSDETINALVVRIGASDVSVNGNEVIVKSGKNLAMLINELAKVNLDLSALTGIPGTLGGAIFGNAGQGPKGIWLNTFVKQVKAYVNGEWKTFSREECHFSYRESLFKHTDGPIIIWEIILNIPSGQSDEIQKNVEALLQKRIETQPHLKTAGSCFKAHDGTPAWQLIDKAGLRGLKIGDVQIAEKHANFLLNTGKATFNDAVKIVQTVKEKLPQLDTEMRFINTNGQAIF